MALIDWSDDLSIGVPEIDAQHQHLVELVNGFGEAAARGRGTREVRALLEALYAYTVEHFAAEEAYMATIGYPDLDHHRVLHQQLLTKLDDLRVQFEVGGRRITQPMLELLRYWLVAHLQGADRAICSGQPA